MWLHRPKGEDSSSDEESKEISAAVLSEGLSQTTTHSYKKSLRLSSDQIVSISIRARQCSFCGRKKLHTNSVTTRENINCHYTHTHRHAHTHCTHTLKSTSPVVLCGCCRETDRAHNSAIAGSESFKGDVRLNEVLRCIFSGREVCLCVLCVDMHL